MVLVRRRIQKADLVRPLAERFAPDRVGGHDVAAAERETDLVERLRHALRELDEEGVDAPVLAIVVVGQDETVVLVREQEVLAAPAGPHDDQREGNRRRAQPLGLHPGKRAPDDAGVDVPVDIAQERLHLGHRHVVVEQRLGDLDLGLLDLGEALDALLVGEVVDQLERLLGEHGERRVQGSMPQIRPASSTTGIVAQAPAPHEGDGVVERIRLRHGHDRRRHHRRDACVRFHAAGDAPRHVLLGDDPGWAARAVENDGAGGLAASSRSTSVLTVSSGARRTGAGPRWSLTSRRKICV